MLSADYLPNSLDQTQIRPNKKHVDLGDLQPQGAMGPDVVCDCAISCTYLFVRQILILEIINLPFVHVLTAKIYRFFKKKRQKYPQNAQVRLIRLG